MNKQVMFRHYNKMDDGEDDDGCNGAYDEDEDDAQGSKNNGIMEPLLRVPPPHPSGGEVSLLSGVSASLIRDPTSEH
jgi:hypothetical protein